MRDTVGFIGLGRMGEPMARNLLAAGFKVSAYNRDAAKKLWICASGPAAAKARVRPVLDAMGQGVYDFGEEPHAANVVKLAGNFLILSAIEALGEAAALGQLGSRARARQPGLVGDRAGGLRGGRPQVAGTNFPRCARSISGQ